MEITSHLQYWEERHSIALRALEYIEGQIGKAVLRGIEQLSLPIEAAMEDENREMLDGQV